MRTVSSLAVLSGLLVLAACTPAQRDALDDPFVNDNDPAPTSPAGFDGDAQNDGVEAAMAARAELATRLNVDAQSIVVVSTEAREWSDGCLGLGGPAESCLAAITPGYLVVLEHDGTEYRYRTDVSGEAVRAEE